MDQNKKDVFDDIKMIERICQVHDLDDGAKNKRLYKYLKSQRLFNTWVGKSFLEALGKNGKDSRYRRTIEKCCRLIAGSFLAMAVVLGVSILYFQIEEEKQEAVLAYIREERRQAELQETEDTEEDNSEMEEEPVAILEEYAILYSMNPDLVGWIKIDGTRIDYPVMQNKDNEDYYLSHNFYKQYSYSGTPFVSKNYSPNNNNIIIYGHNVNNQTLFSELINYQNESYYKTHQLNKFDILTQENDYQVIAVFKSRVFYEDEKVFKYYKMDYNLNENEFNYYIDNIKSLSLYHIDTSATYGDKLITLSTCYNEIEDGRFIVVAKLIR